MVKLQAQIELLQELPYQSVYKVDAKLDDLKMKSAVLMDDLIETLNRKRDELSVLNGNKEIAKLKKIIKEQEETITELKKSDEKL